ncbi:MAG TPA: hypothetical protein VM841_06780 [Actinomycetota bacterium]|nr:hypothetical protein [Actinomycetota bacterium]
MKELPLIACSLDASGQKERAAEWRALVARSRGAEMRPDGLHIRVEPGDDAEARRLADLESRCCPFFTFSFEPGGFTVGGSPDAVTAAKRLLLG